MIRAQRLVTGEEVALRVRHSARRPSIDDQLEGGVAWDRSSKHEDHGAVDIVINGRGDGDALAA